MEYSLTETYKITRWGSNPDTLGSYSYYAVGSTPADRVTLGETVGDYLYFAGEAVDVDYYQTTIGAYNTGIRAANAIIDST